MVGQGEKKAEKEQEKVVGRHWPGNDILYRLVNHIKKTAECYKLNSPCHQPDYTRTHTAVDLDVRDIKRIYRRNY